jgi:hypothetical protein
VPTDGIGAAQGTNENFGTFSFQRQLSGKTQLAYLPEMWCRDGKHNGRSGNKTEFVARPKGGVIKWGPRVGRAGLHLPRRLSIRNAGKAANV